MVASPAVFREICMLRRLASSTTRLDRALLSALCMAATLLAQTPASAQAKPPKPGGLPTTNTDMELDPDATPPPPDPKKEELPPADPNAWGVGGKEEEGKFAPQKKKEVVDDDDGPMKLGAPGAAFVDLVVGFGAMRDVTNDQDKTKITLASFVIGGRYRIGDSLTLGARFPYSTGKIVGPGGGTNEFNTFAVGNVELEGRYAFELTHRLHLSPQLAFYLPSASGDLFADASNRGSRAQALVNQAAGFTRGWEENPLFASKRIGIRIGGIVNYDRRAMHIEAGTRIDVMGKTGGNPASLDASGIATQYHTPNYTWLTHASFFYDFLDGMVTPGLRAWLAVAQVPVFTSTRDYSGAQFVIEPGVNGRFPIKKDSNMAIKGGLGFILPLGGQLGGKSLGGQDTGRANGFRLHAEFQF
jgi:hypothetical protein